ncbi:hypothetical protein [Natrinema sp. CBA1119]|uniref:hypothetical protein n=1 Tax=Natrinema sp. CBA1119 TaxID=1608465 RepID=UPI0020D27E4F|nr:hypothetical protein [Natrinema sp. CBA1119]
MEYERSLEAGDGLDAATNREIAERVAHNHRHLTCETVGKGETADVVLELPGGGSDAR